MASCMSLAATVESTPPETAPMTCPFSPQISLIRAISFGMNDSCGQLDRYGEPPILTMLHPARTPQMLLTKPAMTSLPFGLCDTSGWNCTP